MFDGSWLIFEIIHRPTYIGVHRLFLDCAGKSEVLAIIASQQEEAQVLSGKLVRLWGLVSRHPSTFDNIYKLERCQCGLLGAWEPEIGGCCTSWEGRFKSAFA